MFFLHFDFYQNEDDAEISVSMCYHRAADNRALGSVKPVEGKFMYRTTTRLAVTWGPNLVKGLFYLGTDSVWVFCGPRGKGNDSLTKEGTDALTHIFLI